MRRFQRTLGDNCPAAQKARDSRLRGAWLGICSPFHSRPDPRRAWDAAARKDDPYLPWDRVQSPVRSALRAAAKTENQAVIDAVSRKVEEFYDALKADAFSVLPSADPRSVLQFANELSRESAEALCVSQELLAQGMNPCPALIESAAKEARDVARTSESFGSRLVAMLTFPSRAAMRIAR